MRKGNPDQPVAQDQEMWIRKLHFTDIEAEMTSPLYIVYKFELTSKAKFNVLNLSLVYSIAQTWDMVLGSKIHETSLANTPLPPSPSHWPFVICGEGWGGWHGSDTLFLLVHF